MQFHLTFSHFCTVLKTTEWAAKVLVVFYVCSIATCHEGYVAAAYFWFTSVKQEKNQAYVII